jgi:hypothetical protein
MNAPVRKRGDLIRTLIFDCENLREDMQPLLGQDPPIPPFEHLQHVLDVVLIGLRKAVEYEGYLKESK